MGTGQGLEQVERERASTRADADSDDHLAPGRVAALAVAALAAVGGVVVLGTGVADARAWQLVTLILSCAAVAAFALLLPARLRTRLGTAATIFVTAAGFLAMFLQSPPTDDPGRGVDVQKMALLMEDGPLSVDLPHALLPDGIHEVTIADAINPVGAMQIDFRLVSDTEGAAPSEDVTAFVEVYADEETAGARAESGFATAGQTYGQFGELEGDSSHFCSWGDIGGALVCGGRRGLTYVEVYAYPTSTVLQGAAASTVTAVLAYAEEKAALATP